MLLSLQKEKEFISLCVLRVSTTFAQSPLVRSQNNVLCVVQKLVIVIVMCIAPCNWDKDCYYNKKFGGFLDKPEGQIILHCIGLYCCDNIMILLYRILH